MTSKLSPAFFGNKKFTSTIAERLYKGKKQFTNLSSTQVLQIFHPYTQKLQRIVSNQSNLSLLDLFTQLINKILVQFQWLKFDKLSSLIQIAAHAFQYSFQNWLSKNQSFSYFGEVLVRHSLFRPPHSVSVFTYDQMRSINSFWLQNFHRFYQQYQQCFKSQLSQSLICQTPPQIQQKQLQLKDAKIIDSKIATQIIQKFIYQ